MNSNDEIDRFPNGDDGKWLLMQLEQLIGRLDMEWWANHSTEEIDPFPNGHHGQWLLAKQREQERLFNDQFNRESHLYEKSRRYIIMRAQEIVRARHSRG